MRGKSISLKTAFCGLVKALQAAHIFDQGGTWGCGCGEGFVEAALERTAFDAFGATWHLDIHRFERGLCNDFLGELRDLG